MPETAPNTTPDLLTPLTSLPEPPSRKVSDQQRFDDAAYASLKAQQGMVSELNNEFIPPFNKAIPALNDAFENREIIHAAAGHARNAARDAGLAEAAKDTASKWAAAPHGTLVDGNDYSAKHWAEETALVGQTQVGRVETAGNDAVNLVQGAGTEQLNNVQLAGDAAVTRVMDSTGEARQAATEARTAAQQAVSMTGVGPAGKAKFGFVRVGDGLNVTADGTISAAFVSVVSTPSVSFPAIVGISYAYALSMTASTAIPSGRIVRFEVAYGDQPVQSIPATSGAATTSITPTGLASTVLLVVRAVDSEGNVSKDLVMTVSQINVTKTPPGITQPASGATGVGLDNLAVSVQSAALVGISGTPSGTQIQVATDAAFSNLIADTGTSGGYRTSWTLPVSLTRNVKYYARARHKWDIYGWSGYGGVSSFTAQDAYTKALSITAPAASATGVSLLPVVTLSAFTNIGPTDTPSGTQIDIATDAAFTDIKASYSGTYTTSWTCNVALAPIKVHHIRARHSGARFGEGTWTTSSFTTASIQMTVNAPAATALTTPNPTVSVTVTTPAGGVTSRRLDVYQGATLIWQSTAFTGDTVKILANLARGTSYTLAPYVFAGSWVRGTDRPITMSTMFVGDKVEITASGTWTPPVPGAEYGVLLWGGGGGGGGARDGSQSGSGGGGGYVAGTVTRIASSLSITLGSGGGGGTGGAYPSGVGQAGGASSCSALGLTALGGSGGSGVDNGFGGGSGGSGGGAGQRACGGGGQGGGGGGGGHDAGGNGQSGAGGNGVRGLPGGGGGGGGGVYNGGNGAAAGGAGGGYGAGGGGGGWCDPSEFISGSLSGAGRRGPGIGGNGSFAGGGGGGGTGGAGTTGTGGSAGQPRWYNDTVTTICNWGSIIPGAGGGGGNEYGTDGGGGGGGYNDTYAMGGSGGTKHAVQGKPGKPGICVIVLMGV